MTTLVGTAPDQIPTNADLGSLAYQSRDSANVDLLLVASGIIFNAVAISKSIVIPTDNNAMSAGPITINSGVTVTVPSGSTWTVV